MEWKKEAVDKLKCYEARKRALANIPLEMKRLEEAFTGLRSATSDGVPVRGGGSSREDRMLSNIVHRNELELALEQAQKAVALVEGGLKVLSREERRILERFYICPEKGAANRLAEELGIDSKTVYHRKDAALRHFTLCLYGCMES